MTAPTSYAYQWKVNGVNGTGIGSTTNTYIPATADIGKSLTCVVTGTNAAGSVSITTAPTSAVVAAAPQFMNIGVAMGSATTLLNSSDFGLAQYKIMKSGGFYGVRIDVPYSATNVSQYDSSIGAAVTAGLDVLLILDGYNASTTTATAFASFCGSMAAKYAVKGLHHYEILNEPNIGTNWNSTSNQCNPTAYATLIGLCYTAIKAADPQAVILFGGLGISGTTNGSGPDGSGNYSTSLLPGTFISLAYGALSGNSTGHWDAVGVHPFATPATNNNWGAFLNPVGTAGPFGASVYSVMSSNGDAAKPIWITASGNLSNGTIESAYYQSCIPAAQALTATPNVDAFYCFNWYDDADGTYGLVDSTYAAKPALATVEAFLLPDMIVTSVTMSPSAPATGQPVTFSATVKNQGATPTPAGVITGVAFFLDSAEIQFSDTYTTSIPPGASITLNADAGQSWTATVGSHTLQAWVNDVGRYAEANTTNNTLNLTFTIAAPASTGAPLVVPAVNNIGAKLVTVGSSARLKLKGVVVWGINDSITHTSNSGANNLADRVAICQAIANLGGNIMRLRVLGSEWTSQTYQTSAQYITNVVNWRNAASAAGLYTMICNWDSSDSGGINGAGWASNYSTPFPFFTTMYNALKINGADDPNVLWEPFNEPNGVNWTQWQTAMEATVHLFRSNGYQGVLVLDTTTWSHDYSDTYMGNLEAYDATQTASKQHNLMYARHDYLNDYSGNVWSYATWQAGTGNSETAHVIFETEFGNYNGTKFGSSASFSLGETNGYVTNMFTRSNIAGGCAFVWNWVDLNSIANLPSTLVNPWGNDVANWLKNA